MEHDVLPLQAKQILAVGMDNETDEATRRKLKVLEIVAKVYPELSLRIWDVIVRGFDKG
jgi:hypothetical protein